MGYTQLLNCRFVIWLEILTPILKVLVKAFGFSSWVDFCQLEKMPAAGTDWRFEIWSKHIFLVNNTVLWGEAPGLMTLPSPKIKGTQRIRPLQTNVFFI